jgi:hypothetical protein
MLYHYARSKIELFAAKIEANKEADTERDYVLARGPPPLEKFLLLLPIEDLGP